MLRFRNPLVPLPSLGFASQRSVTDFTAGAIVIFFTDITLKSRLVGPSPMFSQCTCCSTEVE